ncbi:phosphoribosylformylglycinamidine synthase [Eubacterium barkeri]|uniref:Phosphoribosylformylglycinamidine synthase n=1 Tax=Eubacterium barkeri TaxID=1528 RepID=A0A1H3FJ14_EUBBA|nr:phosphoribosylformylglycinamidine synthase [Eubacterium barkeri]
MFKGEYFALSFQIPLKKVAKNAKREYNSCIKYKGGVVVIKRYFVEKKPGFNTEAMALAETFRKILNIKGLRGIRIIYRYDVEMLDDDIMEKAKNIIFSEPNVDDVGEDAMAFSDGERVFATEYLPGQYDQHGDSAAQCIQILAGDRPAIKVAKLVVVDGDVDDTQCDRIKEYMINPVDSREASLETRQTLSDATKEPAPIERIEGFCHYSPEALETYRVNMGFAMSPADIQFVQTYFRDEEKREPSLTELKVIDTYWSDHCRHTTFSTCLEAISFEKGPVNAAVAEAFEKYDGTRDVLYGADTERPVTLMDLAVIGTKDIKARGLIPDLDESEEINACSVNISVDHDGEDEDWLLMFKNETHNHPTEIEPFGGAATCLGGAIRDPLSGRSYVYQAMRLTGAWDPRAAIEDTLPGKLPQRKISQEAAHGYSSYGNQIGLATGQVVEVYDPGFLAKRMEVGAVIAAVPKENVRRERPQPGDIILLVGGKTGRDGCGGATGSSKAHTEESIHESGAEVQKGNPVEERKIQRLFRNPELARMILRCNDFGAGGVSVAIGELADSLDIDLDKVPKKYEGLDGTELAISESQERMAVVVAEGDVDAFIAMGNAENLEVTPVAVVTDTGRLVMKWRGDTILDLSRAFLDTNGAAQYTDVVVREPQDKPEVEITGDIAGRTLEMMADLNVASQKGLSEMFDATIGAGTVTMPFGGEYALTPQDGMAAKIPVEHGDTNTCSIMTYGYNPEVAKWSPFHGGISAVVESLAKVVAMGGDFRKTRLSFQEYFERLGDDPEKWGRPFAALLGAFEAQQALGIPAIGGKDSMSGTFEDLTVPPTIISFAVTAGRVDRIVTGELKAPGHKLYLCGIARDDKGLVDYDSVARMLDGVHEMTKSARVVAAKAVGQKGVMEALAKMAMGNKVGIRLSDTLDEAFLFSPNCGAIIVEATEDLDNALLLGETTADPAITLGDLRLDLDAIIEAWQGTLSGVYPENVSVEGPVENVSYTAGPVISAAKTFAAPRVFIPVFPGTNCEYDSARAFEKAGAVPETVIFRNRTATDIESSMSDMVRAIKNAQMIMIPGGFSAGDQPDGSGKFIAAVFRNQAMQDAVMDLIKNRDGLMLGICNGFQALIKLGLVPYGDIVDMKPGMPTLTYNTIGRHISAIPMTKVVSNLSPWLSGAEVGATYRVPVSHGEGRFIASDAVMAELIKKGQIATQYVDAQGNATMDGRYNLNGSTWAVEGITSADGRILGKMGHSERVGTGLYQNIPGEKDQKIFESGVAYYK